MKEFLAIININSKSPNGSSSPKDSQSLEASSDWESFGEDDPFGDFELMFIMARNSFKFSEIPISYFPRKFGETKTNVLKHGARLFKLMLKLHIDFKA